MLNALTVKNFRVLEDFTVSKLGRVNLIVGKNNSGKSSVLEAIRIYAGNANYSLLHTIAAEHDEPVRPANYENKSQEPYLPFECFFTGRAFPKTDGVSIEIGDPTTDDILKIEHIYIMNWEESDTSDQANKISVHKARRIFKSKAASTERKGPLFDTLSLTKKDDFLVLPWRVDAASRQDEYEAFLAKVLPCSIIPTQFISIDELADEWDKNIALTDNQEMVKKALQWIEPRFVDIAFVAKERNVRNEYESRAPYLKRTAKVRLKDQDRPVPLSSMGDGMLRVLQLVLKVFSAKGGFLLIDEFENGLHYSVQEKVWGLVFELAEKLDVQVFATTHSWDCIESFTAVAIQRKEEGVLFRVGRSAKTSDNGKVIATVFDEQHLSNISQADVEVR